MPVVTNIYGTNASNAVSYGFGAVTAGTQIQLSTFTNLAATINAERARRGIGTMSLPVTQPIQAATFNSFCNALVGVGSGASPINVGTLITAAGLNVMITELNNAGAVCTCNCNYCTCNCNYCTCNCNYACTCNCNYSDKRLKENIAFIGVTNGVNVYSFTYLSDSETTYVGAMAQDLLESKYASAVCIDKSGYYTVDYGKLPIKFKIVR